MSSDRNSDLNSKINRRRSEWLHLESVGSQRVVSPSPREDENTYGLVCDNTFGTDVKELFLNIKPKIVCKSVYECLFL